MSRLLARTLLSGALALAAMPAAAQSAWNFDEARIGRIFVEGLDESCRASQVGADLLVTSAHCVMEVGSEVPVDPSSISFTPDRAATPDTIILVSDIAVDPEFRREAVPSRDHVGRDIAYLRLSEALDHPGDVMAEADPASGYLATIEIGEDGSYSGLPCPAEIEEGGLIILGCERESGNSGEPVYGMIGGKRAVVGVVSAGGSRGEDPVTFVASPVGALDRIVWVGKARAVPETY